MIPALLALANGSIFHGQAIGFPGKTVGEVVFNTAMTGYQEILTDPSYAKQLVTLTYPQIGNTGVNCEDVESHRIWTDGLIIKSLPRQASSWRQTQTLPEYLRDQSLVAIGGVDTRKLTRIIREQGAMGGCILAAANAGEVLNESAALEAARGFAGLAGMDLAKVVTRNNVLPHTDEDAWSESVWSIGSGYAKAGDQRFHVVAYDFGVKNNILRLLTDRGCALTIVPAQTSAADVLALKPDGIFLSNGPGDPEPCTYAIGAVQTLLETGLPIFGICLGHQILALASGAKSVKMPHGHHGANHPVQDLGSGKVIITSQNHGFAVDEQTLPDCLQATHQSLFDGTLQGVTRKDRPAFGFQGHPEASPGPQDCDYLFDQFVSLMEDRRA